MIVNFSIRNYGSIKDKQILSFEADRSTHLEEYYVASPIEGLRLLRLGLIYGANASGKTTVLKALDFLRSVVLTPLEKKTDVFNFKPFLFDNETARENTLFSIEFIQNGIRYYYEIELTEKIVIREELYFYNPNKANVFKRSTDAEKQFAEISFGGKIKIDKIFEKTLAANTLPNNSVLGGFLKTNIESKELKDVVDWFSNYLSAVIYPQSEFNTGITQLISQSSVRKDTVLGLLRNADFNISDILIKEEEKAGVARGSVAPFSLELEHRVSDKRFILSFGQESQGTQRYYGLAGLLYLLCSKPCAIPIDELETSLHPDLFVHFLLSFLANSKNSQVIATTHNREILSNRDIFRNDVIWITDKDDSCSTDLYSLADFDSSVIRDTSNIYNAYKAGKLGGTPNLGDYYLDINNEGK